MAQQISPEELASFKELLISDMIEIVCLRIYENQSPKLFMVIVQKEKESRNDLRI